MADNIGHSTANDTGDWTNNKEMNPAANSAVTENGLLNQAQNGEDRWRDTEVNIQQSETGNKTGDPGRTPGKAEGEEDFERTGNQ